MKYKEFRAWCNDRACDGCWGPVEAIVCIKTIRDIEKFPFWKRKKAWMRVEKIIVDEIVLPTNKLIEKVYGK